MEEKILQLFVFNEKLKFSEIESLLKIRSNKLAYHIKQLVKKNVLAKEKEYYGLSETAEFLIPYLSEKKSPLVVILIRIGNTRRCFLYKRGKRPFKDKLSLPGGRLLVNEKISDAVVRIMKEKYNISAKLEKINSISHEFVVKKNKKIVHSFILILVSAKTKDKIDLIEIKKNKSRIILSDYKIITSPEEKIKIQEFITPSE
jgi:ADP-ribose pyrophosphatase YjhB (NUDIX family)